MVKPLIGITMGDVAGIGPEILVKALTHPSLTENCRLAVLGDLSALDRTLNLLDLRPSLVILESPERLTTPREAPSFVPITRDVGTRVAWGHVSAEGGGAAAAYIEAAVRLAMEGVLDGIVTCPIHKEGLHLAGYPYPGHTEFLSRLTGTSDVVMMLAGERLRVSLVTIHCALKEVPRLLSREAIRKTISLTYQGLRHDFGVAKPRLAVAALNPHAGEGGRFGDEELRLIAPAVEECRALGMDVSGPFPPDSLFVRACNGSYDAVVCMYHDQGLIPLKLLHFWEGVNITLGLPIVRTSVDHGTAFDIAGRGIADARSLIQAIRTATFMAKNRKIRIQGA